MLRTQELVISPNTTVKDDIWRLLKTISLAIRATSITVTKHSEADVIFGRDIIVHQASLVDWNILRERKRNQQIKDNKN